MNKRLIIGLIGLVGLVSGIQAQNGFNMPYSQFGVGSSGLPYNVPSIARMGGVYYTRSGNNYINPFNPASYGNIEMESFIFDMGIQIEMSTLRKGEKSAYDADGNLGYLAIGLPLTRWWKLACGLMPYSTTEYEAVHTTTAPGIGAVKTIYDGTGGVSHSFIGTAFNIPWIGGQGSSLQLGANLNYLVGDIQRTMSYTFPGNDTTYFMNSRRLKNTRIRNLLFDFGMQMRQPLGKGYTLGVSLVYKPYRDMKVDDEAFVYTYHASDESLVDTVFPTSSSDAVFVSSLRQAHTFGLGLSLESNRHWLVALDATWAGWAGLLYEENADYSIFGGSSQRSAPYSRYALGFERTGNMDAATYWGRMSWSAGAHLTKGELCLAIDGIERIVDEWGVGAGITFPMRKGRSLLTLSVAYSSLGSADLLQRNTVSIGIAVSSCERWFAKRQYN